MNWTSKIFRPMVLFLVAIILASTFLVVSTATNLAENSTSSLSQETSQPQDNGTSTATYPDLIEVVDEAQPSVVSIWTETTTYDFFLRAVPQEGAGTGVIFDAEGYVMTNNHVVEGAESISVTLVDGRTFDATLVGNDSSTDLAVIKIEGTDLPVARLGDSSKLKVGEWVIAIGNALALKGGPTVTEGIVSCIGRSIQESNGTVLYDLIQTSAAINAGNSGGPLINLAGEVMGINTAVASQAEGIGFAISINSAKSVISDLKSYGKVIRPWLGVSVYTVTPSFASQYGLSVTEGVLVTKVSGGSPAEKAGLRSGDVIVRLDGEKVTTAEEAIQAIGAHKIGDQISITYVRNEAENTVSATLAESP